MEKALEILKHYHNLCSQLFVQTGDEEYRDEYVKINEAITELEKAMKPKTCEGCKHKPNDGECYYEPCGTCARFFYDHYSPKDNA
jgi:hypothetical protein